MSTTCGVLGEGTEVVYAYEGEPVKPNIPYYISFMDPDYNMWICRMNYASSNNKICPQQPIMLTRPTIAPTPVIFELMKPDTVVHESVEVKIKFVDPNPCVYSGYWRVAPFNSSTLEGEVVLYGTTSQNAGKFTIHTTNEYYKFSYFNGVDTTSISLSNEYMKDKLLSKKLSGEMEIRFYKNLPYLAICSLSCNVSILQFK